MELFSVQYRKHNSDCWRTNFRLSHITGNESSTLVRGLEGGAVYVFGVAATSAVGRGEMAESTLTLSHTLGTVLKQVSINNHCMVTKIVYIIMKIILFRCSRATNSTHCCRLG